MLLAGITASSEIILLLVDTQYGVVLQSTKLPIPPSVAKDATSLVLQLERASRTQALLLLSPRARGKTREQIRSSVFTVPFTVPERSTIANVLATTDAVDSQWLVMSDHADDDETDEDATKSQLLDRVRVAMEENKPHDADAAFFTWLRPREMQPLLGAKEGKECEADEDVEMEKENEPKFAAVKVRTQSLQ